jgi:hypothetical protein
MTNFTARNAAGITWAENGRQFRPADARVFGVQRPDGLWLSFDGLKPYMVRTKRAAAIVAETLTGGVDGNLWVAAVPA